LARKILLADDSVTAQNMGRKILADAGYEVITVNNGSAALKKIAESRPDLIVLDVYMPGYSGLEVCQRLKESGDTARIPILLTVGKLEPFKPEEARRVRAEAFIVKPFEASELLSALTKLEDKIVPRADSSKPGRFARAIAAVEEGRSYDKSVAIDEDSGWRSRIAFPRKKKEKTVEPEDGDDAAIYNPVNKDLRTVVEHKPAPIAHESKPEEPHVDLGALAPEGLPKDVTPEEIAALAAAAAQVQGITETKAPEPASTQPVPAEPEVRPQAAWDHSGPGARAEGIRVEETSPEPTKVEAQSKVEEIKASASVPEKIEDAAEVEGAQSDRSVLATVAEQTTTNASATFAAQNAQEPAAAASIVGAPLHSPENAESLETPRESAAEPITMAVAVGQNETPSRWQAVAVALAPEEAALVLEDEMRKAQSYMVETTSSVSQPALAAADTPSTTAFTEVVNEGAPTVPLPETLSASDSVTPVVSSVESAPLSSVVGSAPESIAAAVKEFETVTPVPRAIPKPTAVADSGPAPSPTEIVTPLIPETVAETVAAEQNAAPEVTLPQPAIPVASEAVPEAQAAASNFAEPGKAVEEQEPAKVEAQVAAMADSSTPSEDISTEHPEPTATEPLPATEALLPAASVQSSAQTVSAGEPTPRGIADIGKKESEIAATTAAAWASWRRIRETGDARDPSDSQSASEKDSDGQDKAAMAVAAGAEKAPEEVSESSSEETPEIASIVDSVLADLRPRIVEEISKKLGKKK
jgi:twitching motility two-component system response regulator PilH